jgi:hypothetical protein
LDDDLVGLLDAEEEGDGVESLVDEVEDVEGGFPTMEEITDKEADDEG